MGATPLQPGDVRGAWRVVEFTGRRVVRGGCLTRVYRVACVHCGVERETNSRALIVNHANGSTRCRACHRKHVARERAKRQASGCPWCDRKHGRSQLLCAACDRRKVRNGESACGYPRRLNERGRPRPDTDHRCADCAP